MNTYSACGINEMIAMAKSFDDSDIKVLNEILNGKEWSLYHSSFSRLHAHGSHVDLYTVSKVKRFGNLNIDIDPSMDKVSITKENDLIEGDLAKYEEWEAQYSNGIDCIKLIEAGIYNDQEDKLDNDRIYDLIQFFDNVEMLSKRFGDVEFTKAVKQLTAEGVYQIDFFFKVVNAFPEKFNRAVK